MDTNRNNTPHDEHPYSINEEFEIAEFSDDSSVTGEETSPSQLPEALGEDDGDAQPAEMPTNETNEGRFDRKETCGCTSGRTVLTRQANASRCPLCGKTIEQSTEGSASPSAVETEPPAGLGQTISNGLPSLPGTAETSREGNNVLTRERDGNANGGPVPGPVEEEQQQLNTPVHGYSDLSVQIPCQGTNFTFYTLVQRHPEAREQWYSVHFVNSQRFEEESVSRWIRQIQRQQGLSTEVVPFGNEYLTLHECRPFHSIFIDSHMDLTIRFQLVPQMPGYFRIRDANTADKIPLHHIQSLSQHRIPGIPGPIAKVLVECLAGPRQTCQAHLRMTLEYGDTITKMLIPIWS